MQTNFVIISPGRCGSNYLASLLNSHKDILCHGELFGEKEISFAGENTLRIDSLKFRDRLPYLFTKYHLLIERKFSAVGFRLLIDQNQILLEKVIADKRIKKILLLRRNELRRITSVSLAELNQSWQSTEPQKAKKKANIDLIKFIEGYEWLERELKRHLLVLERSKQNYLAIYYEDLNSQNCLKKIQDFLGVSQQELKSLLIKQNPESLEDLIENFEEVNSAFSETKLDWMLSTNL